MRAPKPAVLIALICQNPCWAAETASFLDIGAGARPVSMGSAYTALADDAISIYWNPAGLSAIKKREVIASHAELPQNTRYDFLAYAHTTPQGTFALGFTHLSQGALNGRDSLGRPTGNFQASDAAISFGYSRKTNLLNMGMAIKYVRSHIDSIEAQSFALDAGINKTIRRVTLGAAVRNAGPGLKYDTERNDLPLRLALGLAYKIDTNYAIACEIITAPRGVGSDVAFGGEYSAFKNLYLRAGYTTRTFISGGSNFDAARGLTLGMGLRSDRHELSYAVIPMGELGNNHRFSVGLRF